MPACVGGMTCRCQVSGPVLLYYSQQTDGDLLEDIPMYTPRHRYVY